ncbi:RWD-domain-containing protein [Hesseltinella vesiculosa]|uniref:RWD-domain-containing protein n=1 Tax=Hesseltinella vesiculosa TaxID=101127 RepID=A0A1X2GIC3_9FUNG|nr:RWD-domain-containing protein [Hesseltinella vesiculosa]
MTDYAEERQMELEALESIYPDEYQPISDNEFKISIYPDENENDKQYGVLLHVKYTPTYPDELPEFDIEDLEGTLSDDLHTKLIEELRLVAEESLGMAMVFTMASLLKDQLNEIVMSAQRILQQEVEERRRKAEELENAKFHGTKVTLERFIDWKKKFDKEVAAKDELERQARAKELKNKLTGRQLFESDKTLALSDAKFMEDGDVSVDVTLYDKAERSAMVDDEDQDNDENAVWKRLQDED